MKVLFLDIDGVLNSHGSRVTANGVREGNYRTHLAWSLASIEELKRVIKETNCKIVISSDWRRADQIDRLRAGLAAVGLPEFIDTTPVLNDTPYNAYRYENRGFEIKAWLENNATESYAIVDDHAWMLPEQELYFVQTCDTRGLTANDADRLIGILNVKT